MHALTTCESSSEPSAIEAVAPGELEAVTGGGAVGAILGKLGRSALVGALQGAATSIESGGFGNGNVARGMAAGAVQGLGNAGAALIQRAGQQQ